MNWDIVNSINSQIPDKEGVVLWNLGDVFYGRLFSQQPLENLKRLIAVMKGKHRKLNLILGNHDFQFKKWANFFLKDFCTAYFSKNCSILRV